MAKKTSHSKPASRILNRKATFQYHILEKMEVGIVLAGCEVKSIRIGQVSLAEGFVKIEPESKEMFLYGVDIAPYQHTDPNTAPDRRRRRKLLAHKRQIAKLLTHTAAKGTTIVPMAMYFVRGMAKVEIGVGRGKQQHDKRQTIKNRETDREIRRQMSRKAL